MCTNIDFDRMTSIVEKNIYLIFQTRSLLYGGTNRYNLNFMSCIQLLRWNYIIMLAIQNNALKPHDEKNLKTGKYQP